MLVVPVDQDGHGRAGDDIDPAAGERKALGCEVKHLWRQREARREPGFDRVTIGRGHIEGLARQKTAFVIGNKRIGKIDYELGLGGGGLFSTCRCRHAKAHCERN